MLIAQAGGYSIVQWAILIVGLAAIVGLVIVALRKFNVTVPDFFVQCFWIVVCAVVVIVAILIVARFAGFA